MGDLTPWLLMAGLGAYHGLNPAMGWLFAVSLGLQERDRRAVWRALPAIAIGHELAIVAVTLVVLAFGAAIEPGALHLGAAVALIAFGVFRFARPRAHFRWVKARVNRRELTLWSFLMSTAHGAGLMVAPVLIGSGISTAEGHSHAGAGPGDGGFSLAETGAAVVLHVGAMLLVMGLVAVVVYDRFGTAILRRAWINLDWLWATAFVAAGVVTLFT